MSEQDEARRTPLSDPDNVDMRLVDAEDEGDEDDEEDS